MSFSDIYGIAGSAMQAQTLRLDTVASNLANADSIASSEADAYHALHPVFSAVYQSTLGSSDDVSGAQVATDGVIADSSAVERRYEPNNPLADSDGYIYASNVDTVQEMADMMSASRSYESSIEVLKRVCSGPSSAVFPSSET